MIALGLDRKSTRLNSSHPSISYAVFCLKKKKNGRRAPPRRPARSGRCSRPREPKATAKARAASPIHTASTSTASSRLRFLFFFTDPATTELYTLSLHDALPITLADEPRIFKVFRLRRASATREELRHRR